MQFTPHAVGRPIMHYVHLLILSLVMSFTGLAAAQSDKSLDNLDVYIDGTIEAQMALMDITAVTVSVVKDGEIIFSKGYGLENIEEQEPVSAETSLFRIGSTSKLFTWTAVMQLYEQGRLDLDADVNEYINFTIPNTYDEPITMRHILTHTAGFEEGALGYLIKYFPNKGPELEEAMERYLPERINPPGAVSSYSNYATALAGLIVQNIAGQPFNEYVEEHIFAPLNMNNSSFEEPLPDRLRDNMVTGYTREMGVFAAQPFEMINSFGPAGAMSSSANDMARFMMAHLNNGELDGNRILKEETANEMHSVLFAGDKRLSGMAHGFYEHDYNGHRLIGHGGDTMQFHTDMAIDKEQNLGIFASYMSTTDNTARSAFVKQIYDYYFPDSHDPVTPPEDFSSRADKYAGTYNFLRHNESTIEKAMALFSGAVEVIPTEKNTLFLTGPFNARQYVEIGENLFRQVDGDEQIAFVEGEDGEIELLYFESLPFMALSRVHWFETTFFKLLLPIFCFLLFLHVLINWCYKRKVYHAATPYFRQLAYSAIFTSLANIFFAVFLTVILVTYQEALFGELPFVFKANLIFPVLASILAIVTLVCYVRCWTSGEWRLASKIYYAVVTFAGMYMTLFYYYWNILGWDYYS